MPDRRFLAWKRVTLVLAFASYAFETRAHVQLLYPLALSPNGEV